MKKIVLLSSILFASNLFAADFTIYTDRPTARLQPVADQFKILTGANVAIVELAYPALLKKLQEEGTTSSADVIYTKDLVYQTEIAKLGFYQPFNLNKAIAKVHPSMIDKTHLWTTVTFRARTLVYDPNKTDVSEINSYSDLAKEIYKGRLCLRTSSNSYNQAFVASLIKNEGYDMTKQILTGMVANLAGSIDKGDTTVIENVANGVCELGISNHYYLAQLLSTKPNYPVRIKFLEQNGRGTHVNGSGIGISRTSQNPALSQQFIELLLSESVQFYLADSHLEYPANQELLPTSLIKEWGQFKFDESNWSEIGDHVNQARELVKEVGYL